MSVQCDPKLTQFSGTAPLFPLPNVVLLPHASLPLHIFEPRYRQMTADALEGERLIAMSLLTSDGESQGDALPQIHPIVGLGRIVAHEKLADGRYMLVLRGLTRARVMRETPSKLPYRIGELELCPDLVPANPEFDRQQRADAIASLYCQLFPGVEYQRLIQQAMSVELPLGNICDVIASALPIEPTLAQLFLEEFNTDTRSQMLWQLLKTMAPQEVLTKLQERRGFPPQFSAN